MRTSMNGLGRQLGIGMLLLGLGGLVGPAAANVAWNEQDFDPGTGTTEYFSIDALAVGEVYSAATDRFIGGTEGGFMLHQFTLDIDHNNLRRVHAPVWLNAMTHDPSVDGEIIDVGTAMKTLMATAPPAYDGGFAVARLYLKQDGKIFTETLGSYELGDPAEQWNAAGLVATDFVELVPDGGINFNSHPNFSGNLIEFGFGVSLSYHGNQNVNQNTLAAAFDNVGVRLHLVPEPASLLLLAVGGGLLRRR